MSYYHGWCTMKKCLLGNNMQIMTGIEVNSKADFPKLWEYCPSAEGTRAIFPQLFPQLREISLTIDR